MYRSVRARREYYRRRTWFYGNQDRERDFVCGTARYWSCCAYLENHPLASPMEVGDAIVHNATENVIGDAGAGSPNRLLHIPRDGFRRSLVQNGGFENGPGSWVV